ncbi:MAG: DUF2911 domain-containing protein [Bacteroidetes bacterium]|nr:DUF2911 domain-containing protein [Bacteroidota bacterium]
MKKLILLFSAVVGASAAHAQLDLPQPSPAASVSQVVGLTEIKIEYSAPGVKGRKIFGELLPYNELWRTGANGCTKISFSTPIQLAGNEVPAGTYSIFTIPGENEWTFILNKNYNQSGTSSYKQEEDALRIQVKAATCQERERLNFQIADFDENGGNIVMEWATTRISIPFTVATDAMAMKNIDDAIKGSWRNYANGARYLLDHDGDMHVALDYITQADKINPDSWFVIWIKAQIQYKLNDKKGALNSAKRAHELGMKNVDGFFWKSQVEKALNDWK